MRPLPSIPVLDGYIFNRYNGRMPISAAIHRRLALGLVACAAAAAAAQARPDFSGEWVLNLQESTVPRPISIERGTVRIDHREPAFWFHRSYVIGGTPREASYTGATDGKEFTGTGPQGVHSVSTLRWDGPALVLAMRLEGPGFEATNDVRYELLNDGRRLRATEQGRSPQGNHDAVWIYDRR
jgi:hypothetical protein